MYRKINGTERNENMFCPYCGKEKQDSQFYKSPIKTGEYIKPCKSCVTELYKQALESTKDQGAALWATCMQTGIPMRRAEYTACLDTLEKAAKGKKPSLFMLYHTYLSTSPDKLTGVWDSDMELSNFKDLGDIAKGETDEVALKARWRKQWGGDYEDEDCQWLDDMFDSYTADIFEMDTAMEMRYRDLCKLELEQYKNGVNKDTQSQIKTLMSLLKLDDFKSNQKSDAERAFEKRIAWVEYTKPSECEDLTRFVDMVGYEKDKGEKMRSLRNAVAGTRDYPAIPKEEA